jgi:hypothetical protein
MKKILSFVLVVAMTLTLCLALTSCGEKVECNTCGETFRAKEKNTKEFLGIKSYVCNDCLEDLEEAKDAIGDLFGDK